ncbi:hypothetical protein COO60DRAFT_1557972 [Scenedesmus sp. NREL 46B-D3]|nr:hypothetical protein COO60DRAFT_1557972 [Scenedesmus sp. NREL 46B-D3]
MRAVTSATASFLCSNAARLSLLCNATAGSLTHQALPASAACTASRGRMQTILQQQRLFSSSGISAGNAGPVYLVFGATGGIGSALAHRLTSKAQSGGASPSALVLSGQHDDKLQQLQGTLKGQGEGACKVEVEAADATDPEQVEKVVRAALSRHGRLDGVVNCIGNVAAASALATEVQQLQQDLQVNLFTSFNIVKSSIKAMVAGDAHSSSNASNSSTAHGNDAKRRGAGGCIVLVSAALASHGLPNYESMSAAKAAVEGLARSAAATYAAHNIRVNCVAPGLTRTPQTKKFTKNQQVSGASEQMHPLKELAEPEQVASALAFFLAPENDFITGQVLAVDGGLSTLHPHHAEEYGV